MWIWIMSGIALLFFVLYVSAIRALAVLIKENEQHKELLRIASQTILDHLSE